MTKVLHIIVQVQVDWNKHDIYGHGPFTQARKVKQPANEESVCVYQLHQIIFKKTDVCQLIYIVNDCFCGGIFSCSKPFNNGILLSTMHSQTEVQTLLLIVEQTSHCRASLFFSLHYLLITDHITGWGGGGGGAGVLIMKEVCTLSPMQFCICMELAW